MRQKLYRWDHHSDQPHVIRDKKAKRRLYLVGAPGSIKTLLTALLILPLAGIKVLFNQRRLLAANDNGIGICVNPDDPLPEKLRIQTSELVQMVDELQIDYLLIRIPLANIQHIDHYVEFAQAFSGRNILIDILQDRHHIENTEQLKTALNLIFSSFSKISTVFKIGNSINRRKWAFISIDEYLNFFAIAQQIRDQNFPNIQLLGGNIIDFELPNFARSLFHFKSVKYDGTAAQLYVDRRGAPENKQFGCDLLAKINWFETLIHCSKKTANKLYITETNWPLKDTEPFAPAVGGCMVNESLQATYLVRYFLLAMASGRVHQCYWHQLVAPGYGLIDNRGDKLRKRKAFYSFKLLIQLFNNAEITHFTEVKKNIFSLEAKNKTQTIKAIWANGSTTTMVAPKNGSMVDLTGEAISANSQGMVSISDQVIYFLDTDHA